MNTPPPAGGPTHASIVCYILHRLPDWSRRLTQTSFKFLPYSDVPEAKERRVR